MKRFAWDHAAQTVCQRLLILIRRVRADPRRADIGLYAAAGAYYLFLSLGPLTALLLAALPYTSVTERQLLDMLSPVTPPALLQLMHAVAADIYAAPAAALGISVAAELWSAGKFLSAVVQGVGALSGAGTAGYFRRRLMGAVYTLLLIVFILGNLMLLLFGEGLAGAADRRWPGMAGAGRFLPALRLLILPAGLSSVNALLFRCPPGRQRTLPGAVIAAVSWLAFTRAYSLALGRFGLFGVYGSIAAVLATLYWAYCSLYILYLGAWLNRLISP